MIYDNSGNLIDENSTADNSGSKYVAHRETSTIPNSNNAIVSGSVCNYCKGSGKIFHWEFGQFVKCGACQ